MPPAPLAYTYAHTATEATTGYFSCNPPADMTLEAALERLDATPLDDFLHQHCLRRLCALPAAEVRALLPRAAARGPLAALLRECALLRPDCADMADALPDVTALAVHTPLPYLRWAALPDRKASRAWAELFRANICDHRALPHPDDAEEEAGAPLPCTPEELRALARADAMLAACLPETWRDADMPPAPPVLADMHARALAEPAGPAWQRPPAQETALKALDALMECGIIAGQEMRHQASLSPIALLRPWNVDIAVRNGSLDYSLRGQATTYGRGLSLAGARASYAMEMIERASAYASVSDAGAGTLRDGLPCAGEIVGTVRPMPLIRATYAELQARGMDALNPDTLPLEAPYSGGPLHWIDAKSAAGTRVLVPAQAAYLFCNLDEQALFMAGGSTGLASGNTLDEAKVAALTEIIERDAEATTPFSRARCFTLKSRDERIQALLDDYAARGIHVQFQDITTALGLPCYQCFVMHRRGQVARATAAKLDGAAAALAALTETPYPYPYGEPSGPGLRGLPERVLEDLPSYRLESPAREVAMLERLFAAHGRQVLYVEMTRADLGLPVVRAIVPRMELTAEWDGFSRLPPRIFASYFKASV